MALFHFALTVYILPGFCRPGRFWFVPANPLPEASFNCTHTHLSWTGFSHVPDCYSPCQTIGYPRCFLYTLTAFYGLAQILFHYYLLLCKSVALKRIYFQGEHWDSTHGMQAFPVPNFLPRLRRGLAGALITSPCKHPLDLIQAVAGVSSAVWFLGDSLLRFLYSLTYGSPEMVSVFDPTLFSRLMRLL